MDLQRREHAVVEAVVLVLACAVLLGLGIEELAAVTTLADVS